MNTVRIGKNGEQIAAAGLGCMAMSGGYARPDDAESIATIHAALDAGLSLIDTGDFYGMGHNEMLIGEALKGGRRERAFLSVKFGALRGPDGSYRGYDLRPVAVKNFLSYSLRRLNTDYIDLYQPARYDHMVPLEDTLGTIADLVKAGYVRTIGQSEVNARTLRRAARLHPIAALQIEYSLMSRGIEDDILPATRELGIPVVAYGVLSRGLIRDATLADGAGAGEIRARMPRFQAENFVRNRALVEALSKIAKKRGGSIAQLAFAWLRSRGDDIVPLIGARTRAQLADALAGLELRLTAEELAAIERAVPTDAVAGERYGPAQMKQLDSELRA
ncbi:MAG: aldo/keto reductase [Pseudolabrys sp.]|jgi:aryl-alcohol dehydrogenase-like predicted oxidoreductase